MPQHSLTEYSKNYSQKAGLLWQYYREEPFLDDNSNIANFLAEKEMEKKEQKWTKQKIDRTEWWQKKC